MTEIIFLLVLFIANVIQAITGFAGTVLAMPPATFLLGLDTARVILNIMALLSGLMIAISDPKSIQVKELGKILVFMGLGAVVGSFLLSFAPSESLLLTIYGVIILAVALKNWFYKKEIKLSLVAGCAILFVSGIIHAMFVSGGALLVVYAVLALPNQREFRVTVASTWVILNSALAVSHYQAGYFTPEVCNYILISIIPLIIATIVGTKLAKKMKKEVFLKLTYILLAISGLTLIF